MPLRLDPTFGEELAQAQRPLSGGWICSGSPVAAEIMAGAGLDWLLIDMEHAPNGLESVMAQLHAVSGYPRPGRGADHHQTGARLRCAEHPGADGLHR